jgi:Acetyltransferase (GNAT) domain
VRGFTPGDERLLVDLFERSFGKRITDAHWRWKLKQLPAPCENVWVAVAGDVPVFQYAGIPLTFWLDGQQSTAMVSVDTMTDPAFRRRGLLSTVGRAVYDTWSKAGVPFVLGLPNEQWGSRGPALGWQPLSELRWFVRPVHVEAWLGERFGVSALQRSRILSRGFDAVFERASKHHDVRIQTLDRAMEGFEDLWLRCRERGAIGVCRDRAWIQWRFLSPPLGQYTVLAATRDHEMVGYLAYRLTEDRGQRVGAIAELVTAPDEPVAAGLLLDEVIRCCRASGAVKMVTLAVPGSPTHRALSEKGFFRGKRGFSVQIVMLEKGRNISGLDDGHNWTLTGAEFDVL